MSMSIQIFPRATYWWQHVAFVLRWLLLALLTTLPLTAASEQAPPPAQAVAVQGALQVFVRDGCPHCAEAKIFLSRLSSERPGLRIIYRSIDNDASARDELIQHSKNAGIWPPGVPTFVFDGRVITGFEDAERSGPALLTLVDLASTPATGQVDTRLFGTLSASRLGMPLFTLSVGLLDGFNPCAMWVLLLLLSLLVRLHDRKRMALVAGTFVLVSGAVYFAFMAAWLNIFLVVGMSKPLHWALAIMALAIGAINVKDFFVRERRFSLSIPDSAKPGLYARVRSVLGAETLPASLFAVAVLATMVNFIELLCTAGFPAIYTAVLTQQNLSPSAHYAYLGLYILGYMADDTLMVTTAVIALGSRKLTERAGRWLKLLSGAVMLALGLVMMLRPEWLV